jgi:hypothetical protein
MKSYKLNTLCASAFSAGALAMSAGLCAAAPTSGAWQTDPQNEWVQDRVLERINTVNMVMCVMSNLRADAKVNAGSYLALVNESACQGRGSNDTSDSAGAASAVSYMRAIVESTRASATAPMVVKAWISSEDKTIYVYITVTEAATAGNPNGKFNMQFCGVPNGSSLTQACQMKGELSANGSILTFYESGQDNSGPGYETKLHLSQNGSSSGEGRVYTTEGGTAIDEAFAYNGNVFLRDTACFSRDRSLGQVSTWRYGVYKPNGDRLELANPSFPVTTVIDGSVKYGQAGFWGIYFPDAVMAALRTGSTITRSPEGSGASPTDYTLTKAGGKLYKEAKHTTTLDAGKGQPFRAFASIGGTWGEYELQWDGASIQKLRRFDGGNASTPLSGALTAASLRTAGITTLNGYSQSMGGNLSVAVPASGEFSGASAMSYRTSQVVAPAEMASLDLKCVNRCLKGNLGAADFSNSGSPFAMVTNLGGAQSSEFNGQPTPKSNAVAYTFAAGVMRAAGNPVDASGFDLGGQYQSGVQSGSMVDANDSVSYAQVSCGNTGAQSNSGANLCPGLINQADTTYRYETGPHPWNQYLGLSKGASAVAFDAPMLFPFIASTANTNLASTSQAIGSTLQLQFGGFGQLNGVPGSCVDRDTNAAQACGTSTNERYVPAFSIKDGSEIAANAGAYFVKYLDRELRFAAAPGACGALTVPATAILPGSATDPRLQTGAVPAFSATAPAVVHGVVQ